MTERAQPDERVVDCRVRAATDVLSHRWDGVVLAALGVGPLRRVDLSRGIGQVKDKPLTEALHRLTSTGLVARHPAPRAVMYELTPLGRTFHDGPLQALATWALEHGEALLDPSRDLCQSP